MFGIGTIEELFPKEFARDLSRHGSVFIETRACGEQVPAFPG